MINENSTKAEVLEAVRQDGWALRYASYALKNDREVVLAAVRQDGLALQFASDELLADRDFVVKAAKRFNDESLYNIITDWLQEFC